MYARMAALLSSMMTIAAGVVAIFCFPFATREDGEIPSTSVTITTYLASNSTFEPYSSSHDTDTASAYEVFLSFCGEDTRKGFTDFLYTYLVGASILTFRDDNKLRVGEKISSELLKAIKESKISIPIFSKSYASSKWCLLELEQIAECHKNGGHMIYPIFYDVNPSDVRNQKGCYDRAFRDHDKKLDKEIVRRWRDALRMVGELKGLELKKDTNGHEGELVKNIVEQVLLHLKKNYTHLPKNLVGIDKHMENLTRLLEVDSGRVIIVGIHGMGGLGKTTIAKVTYNQLLENFECHCFLENIRVNSKHHDDTVKLQKQLIFELQNMKSPTFSSVNEGRHKIMCAVRGKRVLIVLDDVDKISQVHMLIGHQSWFGAHSRIIITTRDKNVLDVIETTCEREGLLDVYRSYEPEFMRGPDSLKLFSKHAFMRDSPLEGYEYYSQEVVYIAAGLPLVLVVLGSMLFVLKGKDSWEAKLKQLKAVQPRDVLEKLRISFDALEDAQQQLFLDIVCYFIGCDATRPSYMWDDCEFHPRVGISALVSKSLITIGDNNIFIVHDQVRDLGRHIVREERKLGKQSRFWYKEDGLQALQTGQVTKFVTALTLWKRPKDIYALPDPEPILAWHFRDVPNIRYLSMWRLHLDGDFKHLFSNLRWLHWDFSLKSVPTNFDMENLVILELSSSELIQGGEIWSQIKVGKKLKVLDLSHCYNLSVLPHLSTLAFLEILKLNGCESLCRLDGLEHLKSLKCLDALGCSSLEALPCLYALENLIHLNLEGCTKLDEIQGLEKLVSLKFLDLSRCSNLSGLPHLSTFSSLEILKIMGCKSICRLDGLEHLKSLRYLDASACSRLEELPNLSKLDNLVHLNLKRCEKLVEIQGLEKLGSLQVLNLYNCENLIKIKGLHKLNALEHLVLSMCKSLEGDLDLSESNKLKRIDARDCIKLTVIKGLHKMNLLEQLVVNRCYSLEGYLDLPKSKKLKRIDAGCCEKLTEIKGLHKLNFLELLDLSSCSIKGVLDMSNLNKLKELHASNLEVTNITNSNQLKKLSALYNDKLREFQGLDELEFLGIKGFLSIEELLCLSNLRKLENLQCIYCEKLVQVQGLDKLEYLEDLKIESCKSLERLSALPNFGMLKKIVIVDCDKLGEVEGLGAIESLKLFEIGRCPSLKRLHLPNFGVLKEIEVEYCESLREISGLGAIASLESLHISHCPKLKEIASLQSLERLKWLLICYNKELTAIRGLESLKSLAWLNIRECESIETLPDFSSLEKLKTLDATGCVNLTGIHGLDNLRSLTWLNISGCESIETLPDVSSLNELVKIDATDCVKLAEIRGLGNLQSLGELIVHGCRRLGLLPYLPNTTVRRDPIRDGPGFESWRAGMSISFDWV